MGTSQKGLSPALEGKYKLKGLAKPGELNTPLGMVDLRTISLYKAQRLVNDFDFPYLVSVKQKAPPDTE